MGRCRGRALTVERGHAPVVEDQDKYAGQLSEQPPETAVRMRDAKCFGESRYALVKLGAWGLGLGSGRQTNCLRTQVGRRAKASLPISAFSLVGP